MASIAEQARASRWTGTRMAVEAVTLVLVLAPLLWLAFRWPWIVAAAPHVPHDRRFLWLLPGYAVAVYLLLGEWGLLSRMKYLRPGQRLSRLRPTFLAYLLTTRLELMAILAVLSLAMDRTAVTGVAWAARGFITASLAIVGLTILFFTGFASRAAYKGAARR